MSDQACSSGLSEQALESGLNQLAGAANTLHPYLEDEHLEALDAAWDAGNAVLAKVVAHGMTIREAVGS